MNCPKCGIEVSPGSLFCGKCGAGVTDPAGATLLVATAEEQDKLLVQLRKDLAADYEVEKELGRGGMAVVYRAREIELRRLVALKVLPPGLGSPDMAERFRREARMAAALDHANIIPIYRVGQAAGTYFFAMKFVEGRAVDAIIEQQGALPIPIILQVLLATSRALSFAHERQIIHRDIKGANILVDRDGRVLVSDFGIARAAEEKTLTASGSVIGTPHFMSPEQCSGAKVGPQSDQYSLAVLAFQMLTGQVPFDAESVITIIQHHYFTPVPDIAAVREGVPPELLAVVYRALAKDAAQRFESTRDMAKALEAVPFSAEEKAQSEDLLRELARGDAIPTVRTGSLPPLADTRTVGAAALGVAPTITVVPQRAPAAGAAGKRSRAPLLAAAAVVVLAAGATGTWLATRGPSLPAAADSLAAPGGAPSAGAPTTAQVAQQTVAPGQPAAPGSAAAAERTPVVSAPPPPAGDSAARSRSTPRTTTPATDRQAEARAEPSRPPQQEAPPVVAPPVVPSGTGFLRLRTMPPNAQIIIDGRAVGVGGLVDHELSAGTHRLRLTAPGFVTLDTTFTVEAGGTVRLGTKTLRSEGGP